MSATQTLDSADKVLDHARNESLISPRFYTTDFKAMDRMDMNPVRKEWDTMLAEYEGDNNHDHFTRGRLVRRGDQDAAARAAPGVHGLPGQQHHERIQRLRALQRDPQERHQPRHQGVDDLSDA